ncbi:hypothetical protein KCU77_g7740, partial [Aureobasidium melanogenum]
MLQSWTQQQAILSPTLNTSLPTTLTMSWSTRIGFNAPFDKVAELTRAERPLIIAIHGPPGCGKSYTLNKLSHLLPSKQYLFFETSAILSKLSRGIDRFENADAEQKQVRHLDPLATTSNI